MPNAERSSIQTRPSLLNRLSTGDDAAASEALRAGLGLETDLTDDGVRFRIQDGEQFVPRLFDHLPAGVRSVNVRRPSLDDVFMEYTGHDLRDADAGTADQFRMNAMVRGFRRT